ncbi:MAG: hypothetical protein A4E20_01310 [Nitrospira sp. SG-bin2]|uniref:helix-turn-helix domain-containing protein n=1 Tax=Nitrospira cf. moscoviensis SBR1015 TaxID=96242 RepID=UPI000A0E5EB4|nr:helix-turn-helix domain-containing protein [Nitrospira cf. moscoviensis SBR1015]OQW34842.1 MAG: hypothetical protein A4E20_01310 [Nitrospira sp. SG-bin2]
MLATDVHTHVPSTFNLTRCSRLVSEIPTTNQNRAVLNHIIMKGSISPLEADSLYRVKRLTSRIHELKKMGANIVGEFRKDNTGKRYVRYYIA